MVRIAGKRCAATVLVARTLAAGRSASLRVRLTTAAAKRLRGRRVTVSVKTGVAAGDAKVNRVVRATIRGRR